MPPSLLSASLARHFICAEIPASHTHAPPHPGPLPREREPVCGYRILLSRLNRERRTCSWMLAICSKYSPPERVCEHTPAIFPKFQTPSLAKWHRLPPSPLAGEGLGMRGYASAQAALLTAAACSDDPSPKRSTRWQTWRSSACWWLKTSMPSPRCSHSTINSRQS